MLRFFVTVLLSTALGTTSKINTSCLNGLKLIPDGGNISLNCSFSSFDASVIAWFKHTPEERALLIVSAFGSTLEYSNGFGQTGRFTASREKFSLTLNISNATSTDSATYYCAVAYYVHIALLDCAVLVLKDRKNKNAVLQHALLDPVKPADITTLQCTFFKNTCSEDHRVYWFRHGSGESHPGIIYTHVNSDDQCKKSSETDSTTQSCVYKLPKTNLSLSDTGTYYCAVAACGEILFGNGSQLNLVVGKVLDPAILSLAVSNVISIAVIVYLCRKLCNRHHEDLDEGRTVQINQAEDTGDLNYAALSFTQPSSSRRNRTKNSSDQSVYAQVKTHQKELN